MQLCRLTVCLSILGLVAKKRWWKISDGAIKAAHLEKE